MFDLDKHLWKKRLKRKEFAKLCGISEPTLRKIGNKQPIGRKAAEKVCAVVGCSIISLLAPEKQ
jgi:DNA-binding Xre family transcriptional regulator